VTFASTNPHKAQEIRELFAVYEVAVHHAGKLAAPVEDADTYEGNARIKAIAYAAALGVTCLADDSGVEVAALGGAPGLRSAHYAEAVGTRVERDEANRDKLLLELNALGVVDRAARLVCALCLAEPSGRILFSARGVAAAIVTEAPRGENGSGYDSVLFIPELGKTIAEASATEWNGRSHRAAAVRQLAAYLLAQPRTS